MYILNEEGRLMKALSFAFALILLLFLFASTLQADTLIGKCRFSGSQPSHGLISGSLKIYHSGDLKRVGTRGKIRIWKGTGSVWVIFKNAQDQALNRFEIQGNLQTCVQ